MHTGTAFIITKNKDNKFQVQKSTGFNNEMEFKCLGKVIYDMLKNLKDPLLFDKMIRDFDNRYFKYYAEIMTYSPEEQKTPYIDKDGIEYFEYAQKDNQFKFFKDDNGEYIDRSDSNYIKNLSNEDITIVCSNGNYVLKPNQILITDYDKCINNIKKEVDNNIKIDILNTKEYIPTRKEKNTLDNIIKVFESFGFKVSLLSENGMNNGIEFETWTNGGVDMIHTIYFFDNYQDIYDREKVKNELEEMIDNFSIDEEIDIYRQDKRYKEAFSIKESLEDFENYEEKLNDLSDNFLTKYNEIVAQKFMKNELEKETTKNNKNNIDMEV